MVSQSYRNTSQAAYDCCTAWATSSYQISPEKMFKLAQAAQEKS